MISDQVSRSPGSHPRLHIKTDDWMTQQDFKLLCARINQRFNDQRTFRHEMTPGYFEYPSFEGSCDFEPIGIDSEGGSHD